MTTLISRAFAPRKSQLKSVTILCASDIRSFSQYNFFHQSCCFKENKNVSSRKELRSNEASPLIYSSTRQIHYTANCNARFKLSLKRKETLSELTVSNNDNDTEQGEGEKIGQGYSNSHPYRQLCLWKSKPELAQLLMENQVYNDNGLFITNKPFGVGVRNPPGMSQQKQELTQLTQFHVRGLKISPYTLEDALPDLRYLLNKPQLVLVNSAEKLTSGIAVFAEDENIATRFTKCVKSSKTILGPLYNYHVVTILPPLLTVDPEAEERVGLGRKANFESDVHQPVIFRQFSNNSVKRQEILAIKVKTKVIQAGYNEGSLVQISASKVKNNLLRIHCAEKLAPILGDNLYSSRVRLLNGIPTKIDSSHLIPGTTPQQLSESMLQLLKLKRPEDAIMIPTHVHLRSYNIRKFLGKTTEMEFVAPYPAYFKWTCKQLGINLSDDLKY